MFTDDCPNLEDSLDLIPVEKVAPPIRVDPNELHYLYNFQTKFDVKKTVYITNTQEMPLRINILPTKTEFFSLFYQIPSFLFYGSSMKVVVNFKASQPRHYNDVLKINTADAKSNHLVQVRLFAEPLYDLYIPREIDLGSVSKQEMSTYTFTIKAPGKNKLYFYFQNTNPDDYLSIEPTEGVAIPKSKGVEVNFIYEPREYVTSIYYVRLFVPKISQTPYTIKCYGDCKPKLLVKKKPVKTRRQIFVSEGKPLLEDLIKVNKVSDLDLSLMTMDGINKFLIKKSGSEIDPNELRGPLNWFIAEDVTEYKAYLKYCYWRARTCRKQNQLALVKDEPLIGYDMETFMTEEKCEFLERMRTISWDVYRNRLVDEGIEYEVGKSCENPLRVRKRLVRPFDYDYHFEHSTKFDDPWVFKLRAINQFVQAGRKLIILNRLLKKLNALKTIRKKDIQMFMEQRDLRESSDKWLQFEKEYDVKREMLINRKMEEERLKMEAKLAAKAAKGAKKKGK